MYCDNCGCELGENVRKCPVCGKEFPLIEPEVDDSTTVLTSEPDVDEDDDSTTVLTGGTQGMPQMMQQHRVILCHRSSLRWECHNLRKCHRKAPI